VQLTTLGGFAEAFLGAGAFAGRVAKQRPGTLPG
jgi:hypothetical protein